MAYEKMNNFIITTGRKTNENCIKKSRILAEQYNVPFVVRTNKSLAQIKQEQNCPTALLIKKSKICIHTPDGEIFFHPSMAQLRIKKLLKNKTDNMINAMGLKNGMTVLDCTLGLAADALVSAFVSKCEVIGLEANPLLALAIKEGLQSFVSDVPFLTEAAHNIKVINSNYKNYLRELPDKSIDIVYFDPMFRYSLTASASMQPLRCIADTSAVTMESIQQACRVAKHRVILKENSKSLEFSRLGFQKRYGGRYSPVHYGIIDIKDLQQQNTPE